MYKLLIVDDEPLTREYMKQNISLIDAQWEVSGEASDGTEALGFLLDHKVDLVITDIKMPVMDGLELCKAIYEKYPQQKSIILSGYDEFHFAREAMRYGVNDYLLKPIVKQELQAALYKIAKQIENARRRELTFKAVSNLSEDYKNYIVKNVLKAIISNSNVEIKALYPLIHRLKINILETEGIIMVLSLDIDEVLRMLIPPSDISIFNYILNQITLEIVDQSKVGQVFLDAHENIIVFMSGENSDETVRKCLDAYSKISSFMHKHTGVTATGSIGSSQADLLQMNISYADALDTFRCRIVSGGNTVYKFNHTGICLHQMAKLDKSISAIKSGLLDSNEMAYCVSVSNYVDLIDPLNISTIFRYGVHMIHSVKELRKDYAAELIELAYKTLQGILWENIKMTKEKTIKLFIEIVKLFDLNPLSEGRYPNDQNIVKEAKDFIYAHYPEPISLAQIAEHIGVTSSYLSNLFHKCAGESYIKFLTKVRMEQAAKLLKNKPSLKVYDISEKVGYVSVKHFSHVFKQFFAVTPGEYQNKA